MWVCVGGDCFCCCGGVGGRCCGSGGGYAIVAGGVAIDDLELIYYFNVL